MRLLYAFEYNASAMRVPTFLLMGEKDTVVSNPAIEKFHKNMRCEKKIQTLAGASHELHIDSTREVFNSVIGWIDEKLERECENFVPIPEGQELRFGMLPKDEPYQHKMKMLVIAFAAYMAIGIILTWTRTIFKNGTHGKMIILWPKALWRGK